MSSLKNQVSEAVRILRRNRDVSARATHLEAAYGNVPFATIERKTMSTKTAFKRVALVAAAALAIGGISAVTASAAVNTNLNVAVGYTGAGTSAGSGYAGPANSIAVTATNAVYVTVSGGTFVGGATSATLAAAASISIATPAVGTVTVSGYAQTGPGTYSPTVTDTVTLTVSAVPAPEAYTSSTGYISSVVGAAATSVTDAAVVATPIVVPSGASATPVARLTVSQFNATPAALSVGLTKAVTVSISGAGAVSTANNGTLTGPAAVVGAGVANVSDFYVYSNGVAGVGTITVSVNGATVVTRTVTFAGSFSKFGASTASKTIIPVGGTGTLTLAGQDSNGNTAVLPGTITAASSNTAVATVAYAAGVVTVTGVASGTAVITSTDSGTGATTTSTVTVGGVAASSATITFDKASYAPGEKMTITLTAKDSTGALVGDTAAATNFFAAGGIVANASLIAISGNLANVSPAFTGGVTTYTAYAPLVAGNVIFTATMGAAGTYVASAAAAAVITATAVVAADTSALDAANSAADIAAEALDAANAATDAATAAADAADAATSAAQDAVDAANAATDAANAAADAASNAETAANAATDAANAAADAADSATSAAQDAADAANAATDAANKAADQAGQALAAVNALAVSVAKLIAAVKAQLTSLTNLVVKIQKKVKA